MTNDGIAVTSSGSPWTRDAARTQRRTQLRHNGFQEVFPAPHWKGTRDSRSRVRPNDKRIPLPCIGHTATVVLFKRQQARTEEIVADKPETIHIVAQRIAQKLLREARRLSRQIDRGLGALPPGWSLAAFDPNSLFDAFPCLQMRDGFRLAAYQFVEGGNGNGFAFAIPTRRSLPEPPEDGFSFDWSPSGAPIFCSGERPLPEWVHADIEHFLEGDDSPLSYFQASIFLRELREMGACWHGCSWSTHEVLTSATQIAKQNWKWEEEKPRDWRPVVRQDSSGMLHVAFYSHTGLGQEQIILHSDTFTEGYCLKVDDKIVAFGEGGYVF